MDELMRILFDGLRQQGFVAVLLVTAIFYLHRRMDKLDTKIMECEDDRKNLWERLLTTTQHNEHA